MALFNEYMQSCAHMVLDIADIVRDGDLTPAITCNLRVDEKQRPACVGGKKLAAMVTAESDEMTLAALMKTRESPWHEDNLFCSLAQVCDV